MRNLIWSLYILWLRFRGTRAACGAVRQCHPRLRRRILRAFGAHVGNGTEIHSPCVLMNAKHSFANLQIGDNVYLGPDTLFDLSAPIIIGHRATLSMRCCVATHINVGKGKLNRLYPPEKKEVVIGDDAYLGAGATVLHGIRIGEMALVAAGAVVIADVPACVLVAGVPAREVKRFHEDADQGEDA